VVRSVPVAHTSGEVTPFTHDDIPNGCD